MYTCIAIDDEYSALEILTDYIAEQPTLKLLKTYTNPIIALTAIEKLSKPVDIIFLDIEMPEMSGLELAKLIKHKTRRLIFTTAHPQYAIDSYDLEANDFLLKPIYLPKFIRTIKRLFSNQEFHIKPFVKDSILIKSSEQRNRFVNIKIASILAVEARKGTTKIFLEYDAVFSNSTFAEISNLLPPGQGFSQVHRSFIIAENRIKVLERSHVILNNDLKIPIGRKYAEFYDLMANKKIE